MAKSMKTILTAIRKLRSPRGCSDKEIFEYINSKGHQMYRRTFVSGMKKLKQNRQLTVKNGRYLSIKCQSINCPRRNVKKTKKRFITRQKNARGTLRFSKGRENAKTLVMRGAKARRRQPLPLLPVTRTRTSYNRKERLQALLAEIEGLDETKMLPYQNFDIKTPLKIYKDYQNYLDDPKKKEKKQYNMYVVAHKNEQTNKIDIGYTSGTLQKKVFETNCITLDDAQMLAISECMNRTPCTKIAAKRAEEVTVFTNSRLCLEQLDANNTQEHGRWDFVEKVVEEVDNLKEINVNFVKATEEIPEFKDILQYVKNARGEDKKEREKVKSTMKEILDEVKCRVQKLIDDRAINSD